MICTGARSTVASHHGVYRFRRFVIAHRNGNALEHARSQLLLMLQLRLRLVQIFVCLFTYVNLNIDLKRMPQLGTLELLVMAQRLEWCVSELKRRHHYGPILWTTQVGARRTKLRPLPLASKSFRWFSGVISQF